MTKTTVAKVWGVNEDGEIVASQGTGSSSIVGYLHQDSIPVDSKGRLVVSGLSAKPDAALLLVGGDHPYIQWAGNGLTKLYEDNGIKPYLAINTDSVSNSETPGQAGMLSWDQIKDVNKAGGEVLGHGHRHPSNWQRWNSGIRINYAGAAGTATVAITTTTLTLVGNGGAENVAITLSTASTLTGLKAAIDAVPNWTCTIAAELSGNEEASNVMPIVAARNVKASIANQFFCAAGGIIISVYGSETITSHVSNNGTAFNVFVNGVLAGSFDITTAGFDTLTELVAGINTLGLNIRAALCDNEKLQGRTNYLLGDELSTSLVTFSYRSIHRWGSVTLAADGKTYSGCRIGAGLSQEYIIRRNLSLNKSVAADNGVKLKHFAQPGGAASDWTFATDTEFSSYRVNGFDRALPPVWNWVDHGNPAVRAHQVIDSPYTLAQINAIVDATSDTPGCIVDLLMHAVLPTGSSSYSFPATAGLYYDQTETSWVPAVQYMGAAVSDGRLLNVTPDEVFKLRSQMHKPQNYIFNPRFRHSGEVITGTNTYGRAVPGWDAVISSIVTSISAVSDGIAASYGALAFTANSATIQRALTTTVPLSPGSTYEVGFDLVINSYSSGSGVRASITPMQGALPGFPALSSLSVAAPYAKKSGKVSMFISSPGPSGPNKAIIYGKNSGPFTITAGVNDALSIYLDGVATVNFTLTAGSQTATQVATSINTAVSANASFSNLQAHWNIARAVRGRVVIEAPDMYSDPSYQTISVFGNATNTVFGATSCAAVHDAGGRIGGLDQWAYFNVESAMVGQFTVRFPFCRRVDNFY
jgi:hypothetical protein